MFDVSLGDVTKVNRVLLLLFDMFKVCSTFVRGVSTFTYRRMCSGHSQQQRRLHATLRRATSGRGLCGTTLTKNWLVDN